MLKSKKSFGFTVVEVAVVITVIAVLVVIAITVSSQSRLRGGDDDRFSDVGAIARSMEKYFLDQASATKPTYPSVGYFTTGTDSEKEQRMIGIFGTADGEKLRTVDATSNSFGVATSNVAQTPTVDQYVYQPLKRDGSLCATYPVTTSTPSDQLCVRYVLFYRTAGDDLVKTKESIHQQ